MFMTYICDWHPYGTKQNKRERWNFSYYSSVLFSPMMLHPFSCCSEDYKGGFLQPSSDLVMLRGKILVQVLLKHCDNTSNNFLKDSKSPVNIHLFKVTVATLERGTFLANICIVKFEHINNH